MKATAFLGVNFLPVVTAGLKIREVESVCLLAEFSIGGLFVDPKNGKRKKCDTRCFLVNVLVEALLNDHKK